MRYAYYGYRHEPKKLAFMDGPRVAR